MNLPSQYAWLDGNGPIWLRKAVEYYGLKEGAGSTDNPIIMKWAHDFGIDWYTHDSIAWCSLFAGEVTKEVGLVPPDKNNLLAAVSWANWGIQAPAHFLGVYMVFNRPGGHHVGWYIGEDPNAYHILGGNTGDAVAVARLAKERLMAARWPTSMAIPQNTDKIILADTGQLSQNEA